MIGRREWTVAASAAMAAIFAVTLGLKLRGEIGLVGVGSSAPQFHGVDLRTARPASSAPTSVLRPAPEPRRLRGVESVPGGGSARVHLVLPRSFNDAQQIA